MIRSVIFCVSKRNQRLARTSTKEVQHLVCFHSYCLAKLPEVFLITPSGDPMPPADILGKVIMSLTLAIQHAEMGKLGTTFCQQPGSTGRL